MDYIFQFGAVFGRADQIIDGVLLTIRISVISIVLGFLLGVACAQARLVGPRWLRWIAGTYVEFIRNTPFLVQIFVVAFGLPQLAQHFGLLFRPRPEMAAVVALTINLGAYAAEIVRAGLQSIPKSQIEAAQGLALTPFTIFTRIELPQALTKVYPALSGQFVLHMLGTSVVSTIGVQELTASAGRIQSETFRTFETYVLSTLIYFALAYLFRFGLIALARLALPWRRHARRPA